MKLSIKEMIKPRCLNFETILKKNYHLFSKNLKRKELLEIVNKLAIENYSELNFKTTLLSNTKVQEYIFEESVKNKEIRTYIIGTYTLYSVEDFSKLLYRAYRNLIEGENR